jgi:hypothetical protein
MKKYLLATALGLCAFGQNAEAYPVALTTDGNIPSHVINDTRPIIFRVQQILRSAAPAVKAILSRGESLNGQYADADFDDLKEGSFAGLAIDGEELTNFEGGANLTPAKNPKITDGGAAGDTITLYFDPNTVNSATIPAFRVEYSPHLDGNGNIVSWTCKSYLNKISLGTTYIRPDDSTSSNKVLDPITMNLGWPYDGCETPE